MDSSTSFHHAPARVTDSVGSDRAYGVGRGWLDSSTNKAGGPITAQGYLPRTSCGSCQVALLRGLECKVGMQRPTGARITRLCESMQITSHSGNLSARTRKGPELLPADSSRKRWAKIDVAQPKLKDWEENKNHQ